MALLHYMKPVCGFPGPRGALSLSIPTQAIAEANKEVQKTVGTADGGKRGPYKRYSSNLCAKIAKYACQHGAAAPARYYSKEMEKPLNESTVRQFFMSFNFHQSAQAMNLKQRENLTDEYLYRRKFPIYGTIDLIPSTQYTKHNSSM